MDPTEKQTKCLFCEHLSDNATLSLEHTKEQHGFDLSEYVEKWELDSYCCMRVKKKNIKKKKNFRKKKKKILKN